MGIARRPILNFVGAIPIGICFLAVDAQAVPSISGVQVNQITKGSVRVFWMSSEPTSGDHLRYGPTSSYGLTSAVTIGGSLTTHVWYIAGLAANHLYHFCPQGTGSSGASLCDGTHNDFTFTTAVESGPLPDSPLAPATVDVTMPVQHGKTWTVSTDCGDPTSGLQAALNAASLGDTVVIAAGEVCTGVFNFPPRPGSGWIVVRTSTPDSKLPASGNRILPSQRALLATLRTNGMLASPYPKNYNWPVCDNWGSTDGYIDIGWDLQSVYKCRSGRWQTVTPVGKGSTPPATCNPGDWFYQTNPSDPLNPEMWCIQPNDWEHMILDGNGNGPRSAAVYFKPTANHYRLVGLEITQLPTPVTEPATAYTFLVYNDIPVNDIIIDHCYIHGQAYPSQTMAAIYFTGSRVAVVDSYIDQINIWTPDHHMNERSSQAILIDAGPGPGRIENNYISAVGISVFFTDNDGVTVPTPADYVIRHNYFYSDDSFRFGSPTNLGENHHYFERHHFELKRGQRMLIEGNVLQHSWEEIQQGDLMTFTPRPGESTSGNNLLQISDILVKDNIFRDAADGIVLAGHTDNEAHSPTQQSFPPTTQRMEFTNNVFYNIDGGLTCPQGTYPNGRFTIGLTIEESPEDLVFTHNTVDHLKIAPGYRASKIANGDFATPAANLMVRDNIMPANGGEIINGGPEEGLSSLNALWTRGTAPGWWMDHNVFFNEADLYSEPDKSAKYPSGNFWAAGEESVGFGSLTDPFKIGITAGSPYAGKASDGSNPGVNQSELEAATAHTIDGQWGGTGLLQPTVAPIIAPSSGTFSTSVAVNLYDANNAAVIYYTVNGDAPSTTSTVYQGSFTLTTSATVKAIAIASGMTTSPVVSATITVQTASSSALITITPGDITFHTSAGSGVVSQQTFVIHNTGLGLTSWVAISSASWIALSKTVGTLPAGQSVSLIATFNPSGLSEGAYSQAIVFSAPGASNSPQILRAALTVDHSGAGSPVTVSGGNLDPRIYPNPWRKDKNNGGMLLWDQLKPGSTVGVFTISGHHVATLTADLSGKARLDPNAADIASGIYLYTARNSTGTKKSGKFAVVR